jgi:hypothetical protein
MRIRVATVFALFAISLTSLASEKLPIQMGWDEAKAFLEKAGYQVEQGSGNPDSLRTDVVDGVSYVFSYERAGAATAPVCIAVLGGGPIPWRKRLALLTGKKESEIPRVTPGKPGKLKVNGRSLPIAVEPMEAGAFLGSCD